MGRILGQDKGEEEVAIDQRYSPFQTLITENSSLAASMVCDAESYEITPSVHNPTKVCKEHSNAATRRTKTTVSIRVPSIDISDFSILISDTFSSLSHMDRTWPGSYRHTPSSLGEFVLFARPSTSNSSSFDQQQQPTLTNHQHDSNIQTPSFGNHIAVLSTSRSHNYLRLSRPAGI